MSDPRMVYPWDLVYIENSIMSCVLRRGGIWKAKGHMEYETVTRGEFQLVQKHVQHLKLDFSGHRAFPTLHSAVSKSSL